VFFTIIVTTWLIFISATIRNYCVAEADKRKRAMRAKSKAAGTSSVKRQENIKMLPGADFFKRVATVVHKSEGYCDYIEEARYQVTAISKLTDSMRYEVTTRYRAFALVFHRILQDGRWVDGVLPADYVRPPKIDNSANYAKYKGLELQKLKEEDAAAEATRLRAIEEKTVGGTQKAFVVLEAMTDAMLVIVQAPSVSEVEAAHHELIAKFDELAALLPEADADLALDLCESREKLLAAEQVVIDEEYFFDKTDHGVRESGKRVKKKCCYGACDFDIRHQIFFVVYFSIYGAILFAHVVGRQLLDKEGNESILITFLGVGPQYDMDNNLLQLLWIPVLFGVMHASLFTLALTPLPFARGFWRTIIKCSPGVRNWLPVDDLIQTHRMFGFMLIGGIATGATIWVLTMGFSCWTDIPDACLAFHPDVRTYFDPVENVLFLRQLVWITWFGIIPQLEWRNERPPACCCPRVRQYWFEVLHWSHVFLALFTVGLALFARFPVFCYTLVGWAPYVLDKIVERVLHTHTVGIVLKLDDHSESSSRIHMHAKNNKPVSIHTVLTHPKNYTSNAGQWIFFHVPAIDRTWHPFSLASASGSPTINLEIGVRGWESKNGSWGSWAEAENDVGVKEWDQPHASWTFKLYRYIRRTLHNERSGRRNGQEFNPHEKLPKYCLKRDETTILLKAQVKGPYGAAYEQCVDPRFGASVIMGAGTGVTSALSGLREIIARRASDRPVPPLIWFVWTTQSVDDLLWLWESVSVTIYKAVVQGVLVPHQKHKKNSKTLDWLGMTVYITKGDSKLLAQFVEATEPLNAEEEIKEEETIDADTALDTGDKLLNTVQDVTATAGKATQAVTSAITGVVGTIGSAALSVFKKKKEAEGPAAKREGKMLNRVEVHEWLCDDKRLLLNSMDDKATHVLKLLRFIKQMIGPEDVSVSYCGPGALGYLVNDACKEAGPSYFFVQDTL
jgi:hypothetical protein